MVGMDGSWCPSCGYSVQPGTQFCGSCGGPCEPREGGHVRACTACETLHFPKIEPAIIVLVELPGEPRRCLLGRLQGAGPGRFSTLAGFVEVGECLEDTVVREIREEVGIEVDRIRYFGSQPWPFPHSLMVAYTAHWASGEIAPNVSEIVDARWFRADALPTIPPRLSIARRLIDAWLEEVNG